VEQTVNFKHLPLSPSPKFPEFKKKRWKVDQMCCVFLSKIFTADLRVPLLIKGKRQIIMQPGRKTSQAPIFTPGDLSNS